MQYKCSVDTDFLRFLLHFQYTFSLLLIVLLGQPGFCSCEWGNEQNRYNGNNLHGCFWKITFIKFWTLFEPAFVDYSNFSHQPTPLIVSPVHPIALQLALQFQSVIWFVMDSEVFWQFHAPRWFPDGFCFVSSCTWIVWVRRIWLLLPLYVFVPSDL